MFKYPIVTIALLWLMSSPVWADNSEYYFDYSSIVREAYDLTFQTRFTEAELMLNQVALAEPNNMTRYHVENYIDFLKVFISEDKALFNKLEKNKNSRLKHVKNGDKDSPYYLFTQAELHLQWAIARLKFGQYLTAFNEISEAYDLLTLNQRRFPSFVPNLKTLGLLHAAVGSVPDQYRWGVKLIGGLDGGIQEGLFELQSVLDYAKHHPDFIFETETQILYAYALLHLAEEGDEAWQVINQSELANHHDPLSTFVTANIAIHTGQSNKTIELIEKCKSSPTYYNMPYLDYMLGLAKLQKLDKSCDASFAAFIDSYKGVNYIKEAYQKRAWNALIHEDVATYKYFMLKVLSEGEAEYGADEAAMLEATSNKVPDVDILKARLLFDGGYYHKAYEVLNTFEPAVNTDDLQLEHDYRQARVAQKLKRNNEAIELFKKTMKAGYKLPAAYACKSALELGHIYEILGDFDEARYYFKQTLKIKPKEYRTGLHAKAKAGLNRLEY